MSEFEDRDWELDDHNWSEKAWMSVTDADLLEMILRAKAAAVDRLEIIEWGSGRSTLYYAGLLASLNVGFRWLSLEYDRTFFNQELRPALGRLPSPHVYEVDEDSEAEGLQMDRGSGLHQTVEFVVFDKGRLQPQLRSNKADRAVNLDAYVTLPSRQGRTFDFALVDGRKRRRCLIEASEILAHEGVAVLHDAWRPYYHCAFDAYTAGRRIGDILWIGTQAESSFLDHLIGRSPEQ